MGKLEKYSSYKDSGVVWLGEIPEHWNILKSKYFHKNMKILNTKRACDNVLSLTLRGVVNNNLDSPEGLVPKDYATYQIFDKDDLVFKLIDLENISTSRVGIVHEKGIMSSAYIRLKIGQTSIPRFAYYYYYSLYINQIYNNIGSGVRSTLNPTDLLNIDYIEPNINEQLKIVKYLDKKLEQIDNLIIQKEKLIELLKEQKQIVINDAVTKGLDKDIEFVDSGVEWMGEMPKHWKLMPLKYILKERNERSVSGEETLFMMSQIHGLVVRADYHAKAEVAKDNVGNKKVYKNDLVFNKLKAHLGVFYKSNIDDVGLVSPDYAVYYSNDKIEDLKFLEILFRHPKYIGQFISLATGIVEGLIRLYTDDLFSLKVAVPPKEEQKQIIIHCEKQISKIDNTLELQQNYISKLKEYKASLIDSVVTGKVRV